MSTIADLSDVSLVDIVPGMREPGPAEKEPQRDRTFNRLTAREWTLLSRNVWNDVSSPRNERQTEHGAVYPVRLVERLVAMYSAPGDLIFDPFLGIGTTAVGALGLNRRAAGAELNPRFAELARDWVGDSGGDATTVVHEGDCRQVTRTLEPGSVQLTVTSPPYADFIQRSVQDRERTHKTSYFKTRNNSTVKQYSQDDRDFGNLAYEEFLGDCEQLLGDLFTATSDGGYAVWVVKDARLPPHRPYVPFHSDIARAAENAGWLWHDLIVWDQNEQRSLVLLGYPSRFYTNQNCSFLVVLRKP
jgi:DNA modification methylase